MAHRTHHLLQCAKSDMVLLTAQITGGGAAANCVNAESANAGGGEVVSCTYSATGIYTIVFRHKYPELKFAPTFSFIGTTDGLNAQCTAVDVAAGTATIEVYVGSTKTDLATTDTMYMLWGVRNSGANT